MQSSTSENLERRFSETGATNFAEEKSEKHNGNAVGHIKKSSILAHQIGGERGSGKKTVRAIQVQ